MDDFDGQRPVERATRAELRRLGVSVQDNTLSATMVSLARQIDYARGAASAAQAAAQLRETRAVLFEELNRAPSEEDPVVELAERRRARRLGAG